MVLWSVLSQKDLTIRLDSKDNELLYVKVIRAADFICDDHWVYETENLAILWSLIKPFCWGLSHILYQWHWVTSADSLVGQKSTKSTKRGGHTIISKHLQACYTVIDKNSLKSCQVERHHDGRVNPQSWKKKRVAKQKAQESMSVGEKVHKEWWGRRKWSWGSTKVEFCEEENREKREGREGRGQSGSESPVIALTLSLTEV